MIEMNKQKLIPILSVLLLASCADSENTTVDTNQTTIIETTAAQTDLSETSNSTTEPAETMPVTIKVNEDASLTEQVADTLYFLASTDGNKLHDGYYSSISLMDINFDGIPEIQLYDSAGSAGNFSYFYDLNGSYIGGFGVPSMDISYDCVDNNGRKLFMMSGKSLNYHPQNDEEGPTEYHIITIMDFDTGEEHRYSSTIIYENDTLEYILSATVRTDDIDIEGTATTDEVEKYYNSFMSDYNVVVPVESIQLIISD
jgi:lipoprotein